MNNKNPPDRSQTPHSLTDNQDKLSELPYQRNCEVRHGMVFPENMHRVALGVEYNGAALHGFQKQRSTPRTVQTHLELALSRVANETVSLVCAGRTDAGVHATGQVCHFDTLSARPTKAWVQGVNTHLPESVRVTWAQETEAEFHARFSARSRTYRYIFYSSPVRPATLYRQVTWTNHALDFSAMGEAAKALVGEYDFSAFRAAQCQAMSPIREIEDIRFFSQGNFWVMEITANAFLHHMVRNIAGSLIDIGKGIQPIDWIAFLRDNKDRRLASATAPPWGLYLVYVKYPERFGLPVPPKGPIFIPFP